MDHEKWFNDLLATVEELKQFGPVTTIPAPVPHLMLGRAIEDACFALAIPIRYLVELKKAPLADPVLQADADTDTGVEK